MSYTNENADAEVERILEDRPPSSYGSMHSDDHDEQEEDFDELTTPTTTRVRFSPETTASARTFQSSINPSRVSLREPTITCLVRPPCPSEISRETLCSAIRNVPETDKEQTDGEMKHPQEHQANQLTEGIEGPPEEDYDEIVVHYQEPREPLPLPPEGTGLQFQHTHSLLSLRHVLSAMVKVLSQLRFSGLANFKQTYSFKSVFSTKFPQFKDIQDPLDLADKMIELKGKGKALTVTLKCLESIGRADLAKTLKKTCRRALLQYDLKLHHEHHYYFLYEGCCRPGQQRYISDVYVEPVMVVKAQNELLNSENVLRTIPSTIEETIIRPADIFRPLPHDQKPVRTVVMTGFPACGLTVAVKKFIIDWTEEKCNQDFQFVFPLQIREANLLHANEQSFLKAITRFLPDSEEIRFIEKDDCLSLFIIDTLELNMCPLDFDNNPTITSAREAATLDALLTSLIKGSLLPHARVWITGHVSACHRIPGHLIDRFIELRGFSEAGIQEYFTKRTEAALGRSVFNFMKRSKALEIICHIPLFCWIVSFVFERAFQDPEFVQQAPGVTTFYAQYLIIQMSHSFDKYRGCSLEASRWTHFDVTFTEMLGKMAFRMLKDGRDWFTVEHLASVGLKIEDLQTRDELTFEVQRTSDAVETWVFKFVHITIQEYMAAMFAYVAFRKHGKNVVEPSKLLRFSGTHKDRPLIELYRPAIDRALASPNGHWDMFVIFLVGLMTPGTEDNLYGFQLNHRHLKPKGTEEVVKYIHKKMSENIHPDRRQCLELCLIELEEGKEEVLR